MNVSRGGTLGGTKLPDFYDFHERLAFSEGIAITEELLTHIFNSIPAATEVRKADEHADRNGTDYWVYRKHDLPPVSIDLKNREIDPRELYKSDDACIETTSVYRGPDGKPVLDRDRQEWVNPWLDRHRDTPGWTVNQTKRTDLIVYTWPHSPDLFSTQALRFWILYFPHLCAAAQENWRLWAKRYGERSTRNDRYLTLNVYPPRSEIARAIRKLTTGVVDEHGLVTT